MQLTKQNCVSGFIHISRVADGKTTHLFTRRRCGRWDCPECRELKAKCVQKVIFKLMDQPELRFLTITDLHKTSVEEAWRTFGKRWNRLRLMLTRKYGKFSYIRVIEPHKNPCYPHMHVITTAPVERPALQHYCRRAGFGWMCDVKKVTTMGAVGYISKYLTKEWMHRGADRLRRLTKTRIVQASRDLGAIFSRKSDWELIDTFSNRTHLAVESRRVLQRVARHTQGNFDYNLSSNGFEIHYNNAEYYSNSELFNSDYKQTGAVARRTLNHYKTAEQGIKFLASNASNIRGLMQSAYDEALPKYMHFTCSMPSEAFQEYINTNPDSLAEELDPKQGIISCVDDLPF